jgi:hypothetical protein
MNEQLEQKPPCTVTSINEPNMELMAKAFINLYYALKKEAKIEK